MAHIESDKIRAFLQTLGQRYTQPATLFLLGGSALCLLGNPRSTVDIDYIGDDINPNDLQRAMADIAEEMRIEVEPVPLAQFIPLPPNAEERCIFVDQFGALTVYVFDPYSIALSKLDRGFDTDIEDVVFLIEHEFVRFEQLQTMTLLALTRTSEFDLDAETIHAHLQVVQTQLGYTRQM